MVRSKSALSREESVGGTVLSLTLRQMDSVHFKMKSVLSLTLLFHLPFFPIFFMDRVLLCFPSSQLIKITTTEAELADIREMHEGQLMYLHEYRP